MKQPIQKHWLGLLLVCLNFVVTGCAGLPSKDSVPASNPKPSVQVALTPLQSKPPMAAPKLNDTHALLAAIRSAVDDRSLGSPAYFERIKTLYPEQQIKPFVDDWIFTDPDFFIDRLTSTNRYSTSGYLQSYRFKYQKREDANCISPAMMRTHLGQPHFDYHSAFHHSMRSDDEDKSIRGSYEYYFWVAKDYYLNLSFRFERRPCAFAISSQAVQISKKWPNHYPARLDFVLPPPLYKLWKEAQP